MSLQLILIFSCWSYSIIIVLGVVSVLNSVIKVLFISLSLMLSTSFHKNSYKGLHKLKKFSKIE